MMAVILAGGKGTRLWPMSRERRPKQFFDVVGDRTLIEDTYRRLLRLFPAEKIYAVTTSPLRSLFAEHAPDFPEHQLIIEPSLRDTGPAMGYAAAMLERIAPDEPLVFVPSDHFIGNEELFLRCLETGGRIVEKTGKLADIGITPTFPNTALGYTKIGVKMKTHDGIETFAFAGHTEKPSAAAAETYLKDRSYLWHANYYMWTPRKFLTAIEKYAPELGKGLREMQTIIGSFAGALDDKTKNIADVYAMLPKISFDYAVTEKLAHDQVIILRGDFGWSDIGSWDTVHERLTRAGEDNVVKGSAVVLDSRDCLVSVPSGKVAAVIGLEHVVVVDTGDALLVCRRDQASRVKEAVTKMRQDGLSAFL